MIYKNVVLSAYDYYLPENILTSDEIEDRLSPVYNRLKLPEGRLELMTGIKERRFWNIGTRPSDLSTQAAKSLFEKSRIKPEDIDIVIHASVCRDFLEPSTASVVHHNLGLKDSCSFFDLSNACLGVMSSINVVANMIEQGGIKHALIVSGENSGPLLTQTINHLNTDQSITRKSIKKYFANLTIGSAATAFVISHKDFSDGHQILGGASMSDSSANVLCSGDGNTDSLMMETDSEPLMKAGVKLATTTWLKAKSNLNWENKDAQWVISHQVGKAHEALTLETLGLSNNQTFATYPTLGNTGSAALPVTLIKLADSKKIKKNEQIAMLGIGSGLSSVMLGMRW